MSVESSAASTSRSRFDDDDDEEAQEVGDATETTRPAPAATKRRTISRGRASTGSSTPPARRNAKSRTSVAAAPVIEESEVEVEVEDVASDASSSHETTFPNGRVGSALEDDDADSAEALSSVKEGAVATNSAPVIANTTPAKSDTRQAPSSRTLRRIILRHRVLNTLSSIGPFIRPLLIFAAIILLLLLPLPTPPFAKNTYVDENALQPGQANVGWDWHDVGLSDENSRLIEAVKDKSSHARARFLVERLHDIGLQAHTQEYTFQLPNWGGISRTADQNSELRYGGSLRKLRGVNTYARWNTGRNDGREAVVIAASWLSRWDGRDDPFAAAKDADEGANSAARNGSTPAYVREQRRRTNTRGISIVLALAKYLSHQMHWSKDIIFVFSDGYMDGMQAWCDAYFDSSWSNLEVDPVVGTGSTIWNAIGIDYPADSFSSLVLLHDGIDPKMPNMDVLNTVVRIAERLGHIPVKLPGSEGMGDYNAIDDQDGGGWGSLGVWLEKRAGWGWRGVAKYKRAAKNIAKQIETQTLLRPTGVHGPFLRHQVDAITIYATPARGPYGFWQLGRIVEATMRSFSNLLERLHHSQFFYLLTSPEKFVQLGVYLPVAILLSIAMTLGGISIWMREGQRAEQRKTAFVRLVQSELARHDTSESSKRADVPLETPTHTDLEMDLAVAVSAQGLSTRESSQQLWTLFDTLAAQNRPTARALGLLLACQVLGLGAALVVHMTPLDCAADGLQSCTTLKILSSSTIISVLSLAVYVVWAHRPAKHDTTFLPYDASRYKLSVAHVLHSLTMLEAGLWVAVMSVLNFGLALVTALVLVWPLYLLRIPPTGVEQRTSQSRLSTVSPSPGPEGLDEDSGPTQSVAIPFVAKISGVARFTALVTSAVLFTFFVPYNALWVADALYRTDTMATLPRFVDGLLWDWQIHGTALLPFVFVVYTPIVLQLVVCALIVVVA